MCVRDGISRLAMLLSLITGLTSFRRSQRLRNTNVQFIRKQKKSSTIKCCWKLFIQPYLGTILCLRLLFRNQLFPDEGFSLPSFSKSLLAAELSLFISSKAQFCCALRHTTLCLRTIFAHQHFHSEKFFIFLLSVLPYFALQRISNQNWIKLKPFRYSREPLVKILALTKLFSLPSQLTALRLNWE